MIQPWLYRVLPCHFQLSTHAITQRVQGLVVVVEEEVEGHEGGPQMPGGHPGALPTLAGGHQAALAVAVDPVQLQAS